MRSKFVTETSAPRPSRSPLPPSPAEQYPPQQIPTQDAFSAWSGWIGFAGIMLIVTGMFQIIEGLIALFSHHYYAVPSKGLVVHMSYTGWGWLLLLLAVINMSAGYGVFRTATWARVWAIGVT